jgi:hypothetical protein
MPKNTSRTIASQDCVLRGHPAHSDSTWRYRRSRNRVSGPVLFEDSTAIHTQRKRLY